MLSKTRILYITDGHVFSLMTIIRSERNTFAYFKRQGSASRRKDKVDTLLSNVRLLDLQCCSVIKYTNIYGHGMNTPQK